jgi:hypothetical protein
MNRHIYLTMTPYDRNTTWCSNQQHTKCCIYKTVLHTHDTVNAHILRLYATKRKSLQRAFFFSMALRAHSGSRSLIQLPNHFSQTVRLLGRVIRSPQGHYLNTGQHKQNKRIHTPNIYVLSGIRIHDPSDRASEDSSCLRPRCYCDRLQRALGS